MAVPRPRMYCCTGSTGEAVTRTKAIRLTASRSERILTRFPARRRARRPTVPFMLYPPFL